MIVRLVDAFEQLETSEREDERHSRRSPYVSIVVDQVEKEHIFAFHAYGLMKRVFGFLLE